MTKADEMRAHALAKLGLEYQWGDEFEYVVGGASTAKPTDGDCSGYVFAVYRETAIPWRTGAAWPRLTAHGYKGHALSAIRPYRVGDVILFLDSAGHARHIALIIGVNAAGVVETMEARGEKWGVVKYALDDPVNGVLKRGGRVMRFGWVDLGEQTGAIPGRPMLRYGDKSTYVKEMKVLLNRAQNAGLDPNNNYFGYKTLAEVEEFQASRKLEVDGICGPRTWAALQGVTA